MSEMESAPAEPSAPSAPTSTAEVAAQVIDSYEPSSGDTDSDAGSVTESDDAPAETAPALQAAPTLKAEPQTLSEEESLLKEFGFKDAKKPDGRDHYIPRPKVLQMIASGLKRGQEKWTAERGVIESQANEYRGALDELRQDVLTSDPRVLIEKLAEVNPKFRTFLDSPAQTTAAPAGGDRPQPDVDLGNGQWTYSVEGVEQLAAWKAQQLIEARFKPIEDRDKAAQQQAQEREVAQQIAQRSHTQMQTAQTWPGFGSLAPDGALSEFQTAVLTRLQQDSQQARQRGERPTMSLREAYLEVQAERLSADHNTVREGVLRGLKTAPKAPALSRQATDSPRAPGPVSTSDVASRVLARLERGH